MKSSKKLVEIGFIILILLLNDEFITDNNRITIYTCCDEFYSHYIPIFLNTMLRADKLKKLDFEIGVNLSELNYNEQKAIDYLKKKYKYSNILIKYNFFIKNSTGTYYNNKKVQTWSIRFISQPSIKNKYVYITDIDIVTLVNNFYLFLINDMIKRNSSYSNIVRKNFYPKRLTGLHFCEYKKLYPIPPQTNYEIDDEVLLYNIVKSKGIEIDESTIFRPLFGIHISPHTPDGKKFGGKKYISNWIEYCKSSDFKFIYPLLDNYIKEKINMVNKIFQLKYH